MKFIPSLQAIFVIIIGLTPLSAWAFTEADFVGTWEGTFDSTTFGGSHFDMTLEVQENGFYTDSSDHLMPPYYYPDTQQWEFDEATNRLHFWYLETVYAGQYFYQHFFYEVVSYTGATIEMHYNYWDDPEPHPQAGVITLSRTGLTDIPDGSLPGMASLEKNYPNPFNPSTTLAFTLPQDEMVSLKVYDSRGRLVSLVYEGDLPAGGHRFQWNAEALPAGIYLYRLQGEDFSETRKMALVK